MSTEPSDDAVDPREGVPVISPARVPAYITQHCARHGVLERSTHRVTAVSTPRRRSITPR